MNEITCPVCRKMVDDATVTGVPAQQQSVGDLTVCAYCASPLQLTEHLVMRLLTEKDIAELPDETRIVLEKARWATVRNRKP